MLSFQGASTMIGTSAVTLLYTRHLHPLLNFKNIPLFLILLTKRFEFGSSKPVHRQGPKVVNHRVSMPPSRPAKLPLREKSQKAPRISRSGRKQHRPLRLIRRHKFKQTRPMHLNKLSIHLIKARHWPSLLSKQSLLLSKVKHQSQSHYR